MLYKETVTNWKGIGTPKATTVVLNTNRISSLESVGSGSRFDYSMMPDDRRDKYFTVDTDTSASEIYAFMDIVPGTNVLTLPAYLDGDVSGSTVDQYIRIDDFMYAYAYEHDDTKSWVIFKGGKFITDKALEEFTPGGDFDTRWVGNAPIINEFGGDRAAAPLAIPSPYVATDPDEGIGHPDVIDFGTQWNGYRYWMCFTPLPEVDPDIHENPSVVASNDLETWVVPPGGVNPVYDKEVGKAYQADPDFCLVGSTLYMMWRGRDGSNNFQLQYGSTTDGVNWTARAAATVDAGISLTTGCISPSLYHDGSQFVMYAVKTGATKEFTQILKYTSTLISGPWVEDTVTVIDYSNCDEERLPDRTGNGANAWEPWHINVKMIGSELWFVIYTRGVSGGLNNIYIGRSTDGINILLGKYPVQSHDYDGYGLWDAGRYRCSIVPFIEDGASKLHLLYNGREDLSVGYPMKIGYSKLEAKATDIVVDDSINSINATVRNAKLALANAHSGNYIFGDDFTRVLETVDGLGTASDGTVYTGAENPSTYWRVNGEYAYCRAATANLAVEVGADYAFSMISLWAGLLLYFKYISIDDYVVLDVGGGSLFVKEAGAQVREYQFYSRFNDQHINHYYWTYESGLITMWCNGTKEWTYQITAAMFPVGGATALAAMNAEQTFYIRVSVGDRIYDMMAETL